MQFAGFVKVSLTVDFMLKRKAISIFDMREQSFISRSPKETLAFAEKLARRIKPGAVLLLHGDLGAGKTTFVKGLAKGLGVKDASEVKSPTFVIMHVYKTRIPLYHFDLYRLEKGADLDGIGFQDFLNDPAAIACVEWAERADGDVPRDSYRFYFEVTPDHHRAIRWVEPE